MSREGLPPQVPTYQAEFLVSSHSRFSTASVGASNRKDALAWARQLMHEDASASAATISALYRTLNDFALESALLRDEHGELHHLDPRRGEFIGEKQRGVLSFFKLEPPHVARNGIPDFFSVAFTPSDAVQIAQRLLIEHGENDSLVVISTARDFDPTRPAQQNSVSKDGHQPVLYTVRRGLDGTIRITDEVEAFAKRRAQEIQQELRGLRGAHAPSTFELG